MKVADFFPVWDQLPQEARARLEETAREKTAKKGEALHNGQIDCSGLLLVRAGRLRIFLLSEDGREVTLYRLGAGEICLFSAGCMIRDLFFDLFITAEADSALWVIPPEVYQSIMETSVQLSNFTNGIMATRFSQVMERIDQILWQKLDRRLAAFLLEESGVRGSNRLGITHEALSHHLGCAREVVTRLLNEFQEEGLVALGRGCVDLLDRAGLEDLAEG